MTPTKTKASRKKLVRTVNLVFFCDDANGEWGVTHKDTCKDDSGFNAFWDGRGIFHDVFEHAHEETNQFFRGYRYALNVGGEVAAMGQLMYYVNRCGVGNRFENRYTFTPSDEGAIRTTFDLMQESISYNGGSFGSALESNVPEQKDTGDNVLEYMIGDHYERVKDCQVYDCNGKYPEETERCQDYKDSVTLEKLTNLYRYGYNMGKDCVKPYLRNGGLLRDFIDFWTDFCQTNKAEELGATYKGITFKIYQDKEGLLYWTAVFNPNHLSYDSTPRAHKFFGGQDGMSEVREMEMAY